MNITDIFSNKNKKQPAYSVISSVNPESVEAEAYRRIKTGIEYSNVDKRVQVIQISSAMKGEGKSLTALNLAAVFAEEKRVLLVDLDLRRPKLHRAFKVPNDNGFVALASGKVAFDKAVYRTKHGFDFINAGEKPAYPTTVLSSQSVQKLFAYLREVYDVIIVDGPPSLLVTDALIISKLTDGCVYVVSQTETDKNKAKEGLDALRDYGVNVIGCVFNSCTTAGKGYYKSRYYAAYTD